MRACVVGAGAVGLHLAARLGGLGHEVSAIARGPALAALRAEGATLAIGEEIHASPVRASETAEELGEQDVVFVTVKGPAIASIVASLGALCGPDGLVVFIQNGIPWWYPIGLPAGERAPPPLPMFELGGPILAALRPDQILGGVIHSGNEVTAPGRARNTSPGANRLWIGPVDGRDDARIDGLRAAIEAAGLASPAGADIRARLWAKLVFNIAASGVAVLTRSQESVVRRDPELGRLFVDLMREGMAVAAAYGHGLDAEVDPVAVRERTVDHRSAMLQDLELGRLMEVAEIFEGPRDFARHAGIAAPKLETVAALVRGMARSAGCA